MPEETPVLDALSAITAVSIVGSELPAREHIVARLAALIAVDAPAASYLLNTGSAVEVGITLEDVQSCSSPSPRSSVRRAWCPPRPRSRRRWAWRSPRRGGDRGRARGRRRRGLIPHPRGRGDRPAARPRGRRGFPSSARLRRCSAACGPLAALGYAEFPRSARRRARLAAPDWRAELSLLQGERSFRNRPRLRGGALRAELWLLWGRRSFRNRPASGPPHCPNWRAELSLVQGERSFRNRPRLRGGALRAELWLLWGRRSFRNRPAPGPPRHRRLARGTFAAPGRAEFPNRPRLRGGALRAELWLLWAGGVSAVGPASGRLTAPDWRAEPRRSRGGRFSPVDRPGTRTGSGRPSRRCARRCRRSGRAARPAVDVVRVVPGHPTGPAGPVRRSGGDDPAGPRAGPHEADDVRPERGPDLGADLPAGR